MRCPFCRKDNDKVVNSRDCEDSTAIRRRRECTRCGKRFTTYERVGEMHIKVLKKDGHSEPFQREKIRVGLERACWKRPVASERIEQLVSAIESDVFNEHQEEVDSRTIGEIVMRRLADVDQVAYVRFASVYHEFKDVRDFVTELQPYLHTRITPR
ncbi:MAG: transcriptional regulator NrdR [Planctomycetota bacterium]